MQAVKTLTRACTHLFWVFSVDSSTSTPLSPFLATVGCRSWSWWFVFYFFPSFFLLHFPSQPRAESLRIIECLFEASPNALFEAPCSVWAPLKWDEPQQAMLKLPELPLCLVLLLCWSPAVSVTHFPVRKTFFPLLLSGYLQFWCSKTAPEVLNSTLTSTRLMPGCQINDAGLRFYPCSEINRIWTSGE